MTVAEQKFLEVVPNRMCELTHEIKRFNDNFEKLLALMEKNSGAQEQK